MREQGVAAAAAAAEAAARRQLPEQHPATHRPGPAPSHCGLMASGGLLSYTDGSLCLASGYSFPVEGQSWEGEQKWPVGACHTEPRLMPPKVTISIIAPRALNSNILSLTLSP